MQTRFEHFAVASMMGEPDTPPKANGSLCFAAPWERQAFGIALALSKQGIFEWEDFRAEMIESIAGWEAAHQLDDSSWSYYGVWLQVLERMMSRAGLALPHESMPSETDAAAWHPALIS
jgi:nitrile hydratase accessory protein